MNYITCAANLHCGLNPISVSIKGRGYPLGYNVRYTRLENEKKQNHT